MRSTRMAVIEDDVASMLGQLTIAAQTTNGIHVRYLDTFVNFQSDHTAPLQLEVARLAKISGWGKKRAHKLDAGQRICRDLGIKNIPKSITQCKKALAHLHVNIFDYIDCTRGDVPVEPVFHDLGAFLFPKKAAKQNMLLRALLERMFIH